MCLQIPTLQASCLLLIALLYGQFDQESWLMRATPRLELAGLPKAGALREGQVSLLPESHIIIAPSSASLMWSRSRGQPPVGPSVARSR